MLNYLVLLVLTSVHGSLSFVSLLQGKLDYYPL